MLHNRSALLVVCAILLLAVPMSAQQISGSISGVVKDSQQGIIANAKVQVISDAQGGVVREGTTGADGSFVFTPLQPGAYTIVIEAAGFKKFEQKDVRLFASDRMVLGDLILTVGALTETVTVEAQAAQVQAASAERSGVLTGTQVLGLAMTGRNILDLARTIPGVVYTGSGLGAIQSNGGRGNQNNLQVDGVTNVDTGSNGGALTSTNIDMIAEFKVLTNSQPAEFGRSSGAQLQVVTKSGTRDFHGTGYWFHRHEGLNANTWRNNIEKKPRQLYRYNYQGFNVGGPAFIPGKFNTQRDKLFFFVGIEWQEQLIPQAMRNVTVPLKEERTGDFSQSKDRGNPVKILDPLNNRAQFPENKIPGPRINTDGQKILSWYPEPNALNADVNYNYQSQMSDKWPRREYIYRGDYQINDKWRAYARYIKNFSSQDKVYGQWNADYNIPFAPMRFGDGGWTMVGNVTTILNPTLTNEFVFGSSKNVVSIDPVDDTFLRSKVGVTYKMPFPNADKLQLVQNWRFAGVANGPTSNFNGTPFLNFNHTYDITDNVAKVSGSHTFKFGLYLQKSLKDQTAFTPTNGTIWFDKDQNNPGDSGWDFANALLGNYQRLEQSDIARNGQYRYWNVEWFAQDNYRATSKLTLDYGVRFYWMQPQYDRALQTSAFNPSLYNVANAGVLRYAKVLDGKQYAYDDFTQQYVPYAMNGSIVNTGKGFVNGVYANGMGRAGVDGYPKGLIQGSGILFAPRVGIAYQLMPKTVIRAGGGVFYDRIMGNPIFDMLPNPPSTKRPTFYYGNLGSIPSAESGVFQPASVNGFDFNGEIPTTYNWNFTIQREMPGGILADVGYVGSISRHLVQRINHNAAPLGSAWLPQNQDPLNANPKFDGTTSKAVNYYRPYQGYADATVIGFGASSNYHALQASANRRFGKDLLFGVAYTWSKTLGTTDSDYVGNNPFNMKVADYGPLSYDRTHNLVFNYVYTVPKLIKNPTGGMKALAYITNGWEISGITTMQTGAPTGSGFSVGGWGNLNERYTGSPQVGPRTLLTGKVGYPKELYNWFDTSVFAMPVPKSSKGFDSAIRPLRQPGDHNWDVSIFKNFPLGAESRYIQIRAEMFNAPNMARFSGANFTPAFNQQGQVTNFPKADGKDRFGFGTITGTRDPRIIQLAAKIYF